MLFLEQLFIVGQLLKARSWGLAGWAQVTPVCPSAKGNSCVGRVPAQRGLRLLLSGAGPAALQDQLEGIRLGWGEGQCMQSASIEVPCKAHAVLPGCVNCPLISACPGEEGAQVTLSRVMPVSQAGVFKC